MEILEFKSKITEMGDPIFTWDGRRKNPWIWTQLNRDYAIWKIERNEGMKKYEESPRDLWVNPQACQHIHNKSIKRRREWNRKHTWSNNCQNLSKFDEKHQYICPRRLIGPK